MTGTWDLIAFVEGKEIQVEVDVSRHGKITPRKNFEDMIDIDGTVIGDQLKVRIIDSNMQTHDSLMNISDDYSEVTYGVGTVKPDDCYVIKFVKSDDYSVLKGVKNIAIISLWQV